MKTRTMLETAKKLLEAYSLQHLDEDAYRDLITKSLCDIFKCSYYESEILMYLAEEGSYNYVTNDVDFGLYWDDVNTTITAVYANVGCMYKEKYEFNDFIEFEFLLNSLDMIAKKKDEYIKLKTEQMKSEIREKD